RPPTPTLLPYTTLFRSQPRRDRHRRELRRDLRARDEPPRPDHRRTGPASLQRPADRGASPPRHEADAEGPADLLAQRRPRLRARSEEHTSELQSRGHLV